LKIALFAIFPQSIERTAIALPRAFSTTPAAAAM
jgi:hypothetical protein